MVVSCQPCSLRQAPAPSLGGLLFVTLAGPERRVQRAAERFIVRGRFRTQRGQHASTRLTLLIEIEYRPHGHRSQSLSPALTLMLPFFRARTDHQPANTSPQSPRLRPPIGRQWFRHTVLALCALPRGILDLARSLHGPAQQPCVELWGIVERRW